MPDAVLIAGANGAGKTTFARQIVPALYPSARFLNVDEIQMESASFGHSVAAGRELLRRLAEAEHSRASFALEYNPRIQHVRQSYRLLAGVGYRTSLHFIELPSDDYAVRRVGIRVASGGHSVPEADIRRRFRRGLVLLERVYKPLFDEWYHWFSDDGGLRLVKQHRS